MFGGWSIDEALFNEIRRLLPSGTIMEFGSGDGTDELLKYYRVISIEHNPAYAKKRGNNHILIHAPLNNGWYNLVRLNLDSVDLLLIDGPPGKLRANLPISLFNGITVPVIFDDINRQDDFDAMKRFCNVHEYYFEISEGIQKNFAICKKLG